jgi:hypothetical protein
MSKQTATEWLVDEFKALGIYSSTLKEKCEQAKEMEKEHKIDFANWCRIHDNKYPNEVWTIQQLFDKYIKETYGGENER